jgi:sensor domain CHASE-containing protein
MTIKNKLLILTSIIIFISILSIIIFIYFVTKIHINNNIEFRVQVYKQSLLSLLEGEKSKLNLILNDYANWTELGEYAVVKKDKEWIEENLFPWVKENFGFDLILLIKDDGEIIVNSFIDDLDTSNFILKDGKTKFGYYVTNRGLILYSTSGVYDNDGINFYNAYLTFGYLINEKTLKNYKDILDMDIQLITENYIISTDPTLKKFTLEEEKKLINI